MSGISRQAKQKAGHGCQNSSSAVLEATSALPLPRVSRTRGGAWAKLSRTASPARSRSRASPVAHGEANQLGTCEGVAEAGHPAAWGANGRTCISTHGRMLPRGPPKKRALTRSLRDLARLARDGLSKGAFALLARGSTSPRCASRIFRSGSGRREPVLLVWVFCG